MPDKDNFKFITQDGHGKLRLEQTGKKRILEEQEFTARKKTNNKWFETQDQISYWDDFSKPKIVWGEISDKTKFAIDIHGIFYPEATTFLLTGEHLKYLLCFLNSSLSEYLFSKIGTTTGVGTVRWKKFKIENLLIPMWTPARENILTPMIDNIINASSEQITSLEKQLNDVIFDICELNSDERKFIENQQF